MTLDQAAARAARQQTKAAQQPIYQDIQSERQANLAKAQSQMGFAKAASALAQAAAPRITDTFDSAANATAGYARGLGDAVQAPVDQTIAAHNAFLTQTGAPASALETAAPIGNTAYGLEGYIPASTLQHEGAGFRAAAEMLPADILGRGQQAATAALNDNSTIAKLQQGLADIASKEPGLYQQILGHFQDQAYRGAELNLRSQTLSSENAYRQAELGQSQQRINFDITKQQWEESHAKAVYGLDYAKFVASEQKAAKLQSRHGLTASEWDTTQREAGAYLQDLYQGVPLHVTYPSSSNGLTAPRIDGWKQAPVTYQRAIKLLISRYPALGPRGAIAVANSYYQPGEGGRPQNEPGMFTGLAQALAGGLRSGGKHGGQGDYGVSQGIAANVGQGIGGSYAHSTNAGGFLPGGLHFSYDRQDQGRDIQTAPGAPIIAPGDGYVIRIASDPGGGGGHFGPSYPIVHFTSGPYAGKDVYIGHTVAAVRPGERFRAGAVLSHTQHSGPSNGGAPSGWAEIGFAPGGSPGVFNQPAPF